MELWQEEMDFAPVKKPLAGLFCFVAGVLLLAEREVRQRNGTNVVAGVAERRRSVG